MEGILGAFVSLFVIMDPVGNLPLFIGLSKGLPLKEIRRNADRSVIVAGTLLFIFIFMGLKIFNFFDIKFASFQIAGGIILLIMGILYVFDMPVKLAKSHTPDMSVPMGTPLLTGPGVIMTAMILVKGEGILITVIAALMTLIATWIILINAYALYKVLGEHWTNVISKVMGIVLASIAVDFIVKGVYSIIGAVL